MAGIHPFWCLFGGWDERAVGEIDFAFENEKMCSVRSGFLEWRGGTVLI